MALSQDLLNLAKNVAISIEADSASKAYVNLSQAERIDMAMAYVEAEGKKISAMQSKFLTNEDFRNTIKSVVYNSLKTA